MIPRRFLPGFIFSALAAIAAEAPADLVIRNGQVLTVDAAFHRASALAIKDGVIVAVGTDDDVRGFIGPATRAIDARGQSVIPGIIESHVHATGVARAEAAQPFRQLSSIGEIQDWVRQQAKAVAPGAWITLPRVELTRIRERRFPTRAELDAASRDHPVVLTWQYANKVRQILNTRALAAAGITKDMEAPPSGKIILGADGAPSGVLENCSALVTKFIASPAVSDAAYEDALARLLRTYNEIGITSIGERNSNVDGYRTYERLRDQGRLPVRVNVTIGLNTDGTIEGTEKAIRALPFKFADGDDWVRVGPLKAGVDGGVLYATAYLREPYGPQAFSLYSISDPAYRGDLRISPDKLKNIIRTGHRLGWQMATHVTGDAGVDAVLDAVEASNADSPVAPRRFNLIHAYFPNEETARRAARLGVVVDTQPAWFFKDGDALAGALGEKRIAAFIGVRTWLAGGAKVVLNSDHMLGFDPDLSLNPYNPFRAIETAVTRRTEGGSVKGADQKITREEALRMFTSDAAWMSFDEKRKGSLEVGKFGDVAILTGDYLNCPEEKLHELRAAVTIVGGKVIYERP